FTTLPTLPPVAGAAPAFWFRYTSTPGNLTISKLPALIGVPPIATKIFLFASMSREFKCQCPLVTPAALTGNGCADVNAGTSMEITQTARSSFFTANLRGISSSKSQNPNPKSQIPNPNGRLPKNGRIHRGVND